MKHLLLALLIAAAISSCGGEKKGSSTATSKLVEIDVHKPRSSIAVVFVHGVFGDVVGTWGREGSAGFFDLIKSDSSIGPGIDVFAFGYPSEMLNKASLGIDEAANLLHDRLEDAGILKYGSVVFVNHSMGGLVTMHMLIRRKEVRKLVPAIVLYSTPQSGAEIASIAKYVSPNAALQNLVPGDKDIFVRDLNDSWKGLPGDDRPKIYCAYEKLKTGPVLVVDWASATRFCDGPATPVAANHVNIVKPDSADGDAYLVFRKALKPILEKGGGPSLDLRDVVEDNGKSIVLIDEPTARKDFRIRNVGGGELKVSFENFPTALNLLGGEPEATIGSGKQIDYQVSLRWGASVPEVDFRLSSNATEAKQIVVKIPALQKIEAQRAQLSSKVLTALNAQFSNPEDIEYFKTANDTNAKARLVRTVRDVIDKSDPGMTESGKWIVAAEILQAANWPELSKLATDGAINQEPTLVKDPGVRMLVAENAAFLGVPSISGITALSGDAVEAQAARIHTPFTAGEQIHLASRLSTSMGNFKAFRTESLALQSDVAAVRGDEKNSAAALKEAAVITATPFNVERWNRALKKIAP